MENYEKCGKWYLDLGERLEKSKELKESDVYMEGMVVFSRGGFCPACVRCDDFKDCFDLK